VGKRIRIAASPSTEELLSLQQIRRSWDHIVFIKQLSISMGFLYTKYDVQSMCCNNNQ